MGNTWLKYTFCIASIYILNIHSIFLYIDFCMTYIICPFLRMPKPLGHAFHQGGVCDNLCISGNYGTTIYLSIKLSTQVPKYSRTKLKHQY